MVKGEVKIAIATRARVTVAGWEACIIKKRTILSFLLLNILINVD